MKFKYDPNISYQKEAINSVIDLFEGIKSKKSKVKQNEVDLLSYEVDSNVLNIKKQKDILLDNLNEIQEKNGLKENDELKSSSPNEEIFSPDFTIEMETGTGKTYVYLRTILELNKKYGLNKFVIVVPSIAIREGVLEESNRLKNHFNKLYNINYNIYNYDSSKLNKLEQFGRSNNVEIIVMTIDSFNKSRNIINKYNDRLGRKPIDFIQKTNPIVLMDEPQNMETKIARESIDNLNPLFKLRYSATHRKLYNLVYRLGPVEAKKRGLVKNTSVASVVKKNDYNHVFVRVNSIERDTRGLKAKVKIIKSYNDGPKRVEVTVRKDDSLYDKSNQVEEYKDFVVSEINKGFNYVRFKNGVEIEEGNGIGLERQELMRLQIRKTIELHLRKQYRLKKGNIPVKVLSLFFIDKVDSYVKEDGFIRKTFIKELKRMKEKDAKWTNLLNDVDISDLHSGYFAKKDDGDYYSDKSLKYMRKDTDTYQLIMKDTEKILSFDEPLQFIFSHSALREGWDNPNIFNICTLNYSYSKIKKRQEIGRGVRIPRNSKGDRVVDNDGKIKSRVNEIAPLDVIVNESYRDFVSKLQNEYDSRFGEDKIDAKDMVKNRRNKKIYSIRKEDKIGQPLYNNFDEVWDKISFISNYSIDLDSDKFKKECIQKLSNLKVSDIKIEFNRSEIGLEREDEKVEVNSKILGKRDKESNLNFNIGNFVEKIANETNLTRNTITEIILKSNSLNQLMKNPNEYIRKVKKILKKTKSKMIAKKGKNINYHISDSKYSIDRFKEEKSGFIRDNSYPTLTKSRKGLYEFVKVDSQAEENFVKELDNDDRVILYVKLPNWYSIPTPFGGYTLDWVILWKEKEDIGDNEGDLKVLIRETKSVNDITNLRPKEKHKISCGIKHFEKILSNVDNIDFAVSNIKDKDNINLNEVLFTRKINHPSILY